jgi:predicted esterase
VLAHLTPFRCLALIWAASILLAATGSQTYDPTALESQLTKTRAQVLSAYARVAAETGAADQLVERLDADQAAVQLADSNDTAQAEPLWLRAGLDISLAQQLIDPASPLPTPTTGAQMRLFTSSADHTLQPVAVYVPAHVDLGRPAALVVMLHGQGQTETEFLSDPSLRQLADASESILAVPWARGDRPLDATTTADVYDAAARLTTDFKIDGRRVYLAGYSLGGFEVFMIAPHAANRWAGVLSVGGSLTNGDKDSFTRSMQGKPVYFVIGSDDPLVKAQYVKGASGYLNANGVDSHYYEERGGVHSLSSVLPSVQRAWNDMLAGVHFNTPEPDNPSPLPTPSLRY